MSGCEGCARVHGSPVEAGCERCLGDVGADTVIMQYSRQYDGSVEAREVAAVEDVMERYFPSSVDIQAQVLTKRLRTKMKCSGLWTLAETDAMIELVKLMEGCGLLDALLEGVRRKEAGAVSEMLIVKNPRYTAVAQGDGPGGSAGDS